MGKPVRFWGIRITVMVTIMATLRAITRVTRRATRKAALAVSRCLGADSRFGFRSIHLSGSD